MQNAMNESFSKNISLKYEEDQSRKTKNQSFDSRLSHNERLLQKKKNCSQYIASDSQFFLSDKNQLLSD